MTLFVVLILSLTVHEWAHAGVATLLGDETAREQGRLSLNPIRHLDPIGGVLLFALALTGIGIGWAKPVPISPGRLAHPSRALALIAFAGPLSNLVLAVVSGVLWSATHFSFLLVAVWVNLALALFNLLPLFPLDGHRLLLALVRPRWREQTERAMVKAGLLPLLLLLVLEWWTPFRPLSQLLLPAVRSGAETILTLIPF